MPDFPPHSPAKIVSLTRVRCPICGKYPTPEFKPFCSKRCADIDLGKWLDGGYRLPTNEEPNLEDFDPADPEG